LLPEAQRLLDQLQETAAMVQRVGSGSVGRLTIGFVPPAPDKALPQLLRAFSARSPEVELYLREMTPDVIVRALADDQIDLGFLYLPVDDPELQVMTVTAEPLVAVLPADHRLASRTKIAVRELADERFILPARYGVSGLYSEVVSVCRRAGFLPVAVQKEVWLMQTIIGLVAAGLGVALEPASVQNLRRSGVVYIPLSDQSEVALAAVWRRDRSSAVLGAFIEVLTAYREAQPKRKPSRASNGT
jgi:DNA-binding transcriptional LysR family regulator